MTATSRPGRALAIPVIGAVLVAIWVANHVSRDIPFDSDEANHANIALRQFQDLRDGRIVDFLRHSFRTGQFPFLHGWTVVPSMALFGTTLFAARVAQCLLFVAGTAATGWAAFDASGGDRRAAAIGAALFAGSPLLATYSGLCMLETPGAAMTALALAAFAHACRCEGRAAFAWHAATAAFALATWFTKINYGLWIVPAIGAGHAVRWLRSVDRRTALREALVYCGVVALALGLWYSSASQRDAFLGMLHNPSQAVSIESDDPTFRVPGLRGENFTAYFGLVAGGYHIHWTLGALVFLAFAWGAREALRNGPVAAAVACLAWTWLVLSMGFREYPMARFIASALPAFWIVAAVGAADLLRRTTSRALPVVGAVALAVLVGAQVVRLPASMAAEYEVDASFTPVFDFLADTIPPKSSVLAVGYTDHTSARTLDWWLGAREGHAWRDFNVVGLNSERIFESPKRFDDWMTKPRPWGDADWSSVVVEFATGPRYPDREIVVARTAAMWHDAVRRYDARLERMATKRFDDLDVEVTVWRDKSPPKHLGTHGGD